MNSPRLILSNLAQLVKSLFSQGTVAALLILLVVLLFIVELPPLLLDFLIVGNLFISLVLALHGLFIDTPLRLFSFPTILVLTTLFRLGLNVSATKLILLHGNTGLNAAGGVIQGFGEFVVRGRPEVGAIVFGIVAVVNFVVIAKGSARVAEVAARFVLDALPGRQLTIEAEMRSGSITKKEAARLRDDLTRESQFFGAMDGAMKWVQGDAVAALVIVFINAVGGILLGTMRHNMTISQAANNFGVLAIGEGLVSILPALLVSVAAGLIVTHVAGRDRKGTGGNIVQQVVSDPRPLLIAAITLVVVSLISLLGIVQFPVLPFLAFGAVVLFFLGGRRVEEPIPAGDAGSRVPYTAADYPAPAAEALLVPLLHNGDGIVMHQAVVCIDPSLLGYSNGEEEFSGLFQEFIRDAREHLFAERGIKMPEVKLFPRRDCSGGQYKVLLRGRSARSGTANNGEVLAVVSQATLQILGLRGLRESRHPVHQRPAVWLDASPGDIEALRRLHSEVLSAAEFVAAETVGSILEHLDEFFGLNEVRLMLDAFREQTPHLISEIFEGGRLSYPEFTEVLRRLVRERVCIRDIPLILEGVVEFSAMHPQEDGRQEWLAEMHAFLRVVLQRSIVEDASGPGGELRVFVLSKEIEEEFRSAVSMWDYSRAKLALDPDMESELRQQSRLLFRPVVERGSLPVVLLCSDDIRPAVHDFFARQMSAGEWIRTVAYQELPGDSTPEPIGVLTVS